MRTRTARGCLLSLIVCGIVGWFGGPPTAGADEPASAAGPILILLKSGRVPAERMDTIVEMVCDRGNENDLAYIFAQATAKEGGYTGTLRQQALEGLATAAEQRKVRPAGDLSPLGGLVRDADDAAAQQIAVRLAGSWKVAELADALKAIAIDNESSRPLRESAIAALLKIGGPTCEAAIRSLMAPDHEESTRYLGVAALARINVDEAAAKAAEILAAGAGHADPAPVIDAFLGKQGGPAKLADALAKQKISPDVAKMALRYIYSSGRSDPPLVAVLTKAAGIIADPKPPTNAELQKLVAEVASHGDPDRGERIFRRADLNCVKCHAVSKAGGHVGPDLSGLGATSPVDYLVMSVLVPDAAIKEHYTSLTVVTLDGEIINGIVVELNDEHVILRDANGHVKVIPADDIDEAVEGKSLMPKGLVNLMTHNEFIDLVRFLSELGKPGPYEIRSTPSIQRWRMLRDVTPELAASVPNIETLGDQVLQAPEDKFVSVYAMVNGTLPLEELTGGESRILYLQGEVEVTEGGPVGLRLDSTAGIQLWVGDESLAPAEEMTVELDRGIHKLTVRVDTSKRVPPALKVDVFRPAGSAAEYTVVGGA